MTTITIELPDELAKEAQAANIFSPERLSLALKKMREVESIDAIWEKIETNTPSENFNEDDVMEHINTLVHEVRRSK